MTAFLLIQRVLHAKQLKIGQFYSLSTFFVQFKIISRTELSKASYQKLTNNKSFKPSGKKMCSKHFLLNFFRVMV